MVLSLFIVVMEDIHKTQIEEVLPYQYEPEIEAETGYLSTNSGSKQDSELSWSDEKIGHKFERVNAWRL